MEKPETTMFEIDPHGRVAGPFYHGTFEGLVEYLSLKDGKKYVTAKPTAGRPENAKNRLHSHAVIERVRMDPLHYLWVEVNVRYASELKWIKVFRRTETELIPVYSDAPKVFIEKMINEFWTMAEAGTLKQGMLAFLWKNNLKRPANEEI